MLNHPVSSLQMVGNTRNALGVLYVWWDLNLEYFDFGKPRCVQVSPMSCKQVDRLAEQHGGQCKTQLGVKECDGIGDHFADVKPMPRERGLPSNNRGERRVILVLSLRYPTSREHYCSE